MRRLLVLLFLLLVVALASRHVLNVPVNTRNSETVKVEIQEGIGARAIAKKLDDAGVVRSPTGLVLAMLLRRVRGDLKAGTYEFSQAESGRGIIARLVRGDTEPTDISVTFPEGFTLEQVAARLDARGLTTKDAFSAAANVGRFRDEFSVLASVQGTESLEGYLFPDTYRFHRGTSTEDMIRRLLRRFAEQWEVALTETRTEKPTSSVHDVVTMASIVEREVTSPEDRRLVAGILWKRLDLGIGLDADATIRYVLNDWERPLTVDDLRVDSPYNTRRYRGLPPGPIGNPGLESLKAVLAPTPSDYLYYLSASDDGRTIFSKTLDEHRQAKTQYLRP